MPNIHIDSDGFVEATTSTTAGIALSITVDVETVVCVNTHVSGDAGRQELNAGATLNVTAESDNEQIVVVLHPGNLDAKCKGNRGDDLPKAGGPGGP